MDVERSLSNQSALTDNSEGMGPWVVIQDARFQLQPFPNTMCSTSNLSAIRVITALLDHAPNEEGQLYIAKAIIDAVKEKTIEDKAVELANLAQAWLDGLLLPMKALITTRNSVNPSPFSTPMVEQTSILIKKTTRGDQTALRKLAFSREDYKCAVSGDFSFDHASHKVVDPGDTVVSVLVATHILPFALNYFDASKRRELFNASLTWDMIRSWTGLDIQTLAGSEINAPKNVLLLRADLHSLFGSSGLWFIPTGCPDEYRVGTQHRNTYTDTIVTFVDHSNGGIEVPSAEFLALHAAFARVFYASGAAEYIEQIWRDPSAVHQLRSNGSSDAATLIRTAFTSRVSESNEM